MADLIDTSQARDLLRGACTSCASHAAHVPLEVSSDFENGNGTSIEELSPDRWKCELTGDIIYGPWYFLEIRETAGIERNVIFEIHGIPQLQDVYHQADCPVVQVEPGPWYKVPESSVKLVHTRNKRRFQKPLVWFWEKGEPVPEDRTMELDTSEVHIALYVPPHGTVRLAGTYPYTYSMLRAWVARLNTSPAYKKYVRCRDIGKTEEGRELFLIQVTDFDVPAGQKQSLLLTARHHPSMESAPSHGLEALVDCLCDGSERSRRILKSTIISIVPMVNADGVVSGEPHYNGRGTDVWLDYSERTSTEAAAVYRVMTELQPDFFADFHGWLIHYAGEWPYDGAYLNIQSAEEHDSDHYVKIRDIMKSNVSGFASYALYEHMGPQTPITTVYRDFHTLGCCLEINPSMSSLVQIGERAIAYVTGMVDVMLMTWEGYPGPGVPNRELLGLDGVHLFAWGDDFGETRRSRVQLWQNRDRITLEKTEGQNGIVVRLTVDCEINARGALRIDMGGGDEECAGEQGCQRGSSNPDPGSGRTISRVLVDGQECEVQLSQDRRWVFVPVALSKRSSTIEALLG